MYMPVASIEPHKPCVTGLLSILHMADSVTTPRTPSQTGVLAEKLNQRAKVNMARTLRKQGLWDSMLATGKDMSKAAQARLAAL